MEHWNEDQCFHQSGRTRSQVGIRKTSPTRGQTENHDSSVDNREERKRRTACQYKERENDTEIAMLPSNMQRSIEVNGGNNHHI
jgi:hypothetical protein